MHCFTGGVGRIARARRVPVADIATVAPIEEVITGAPVEVVALLEALSELKEQQPQWVEAIEHRFYGGLTLDETAHMMDIDERTVRRWWERACLLLSQRVVQLMNAEVAGELCL